MAKLAQLVGLSPLEAFAMSDFQANVLALHVQDALIKEALNRPQTLSTPMMRAVRSRSARVVRGIVGTGSGTGEGGSDDSGPLGPPPE